jgi:hypothetical protein
LALDAVDVRRRAVDLIDGHDDRNLGGASVADRLDGLRHDAVVCRYYQHRDVGHLSASRPHCRKRRVTRRVKECQGGAVIIDLVSADVLRDAASFAVDDFGVPDSVQ